jgi:hypothetical protein
MPYNALTTLFRTPAAPPTPLPVPFCTTAALPQSFRIIYDTAGSVAVIPTSFRHRRLLHYRTADIVARRLQDHRFRRCRLRLRSLSASSPPVRDENLPSEGTASVMADRRRATGDREKNDGNE